MRMRTDVLQSLTLSRLCLEMGYKGCIQSIVQENGMYFAGKHPFSENPSPSSVPCRCMSVPRGD